MVYKANQIIPQIAENKTKSGTFKMPMVCPCCGEKLIVRTTPGGSRQMYCENPYCAAKLIRKFTHFCEKTRMNIEGLSQTTLSKFLGHGWIRNFGDLYELEKYRDEFLQTPGFGEKSFERLLASIEKSRHCTLARFIAGLGIPMVGRHAGRDLDRYFGGSWEAFEQAIQDGFDFTQLHDFGETMNNNIYIWYADAEEWLGGTSAEKLLQYGKARPDGKSLSRVARLCTAQKFDFLFTASSGPGDKDSKGLIVPRFGKKPENHVAVGMTWDALAELLLITKTHYEAWLAAWYLSQIQAANPQPPAKTRKAPEIPAQQPEPAIQSQYVMPEYSGKSLF